MRLLSTSSLACLLLALSQSVRSTADLSRAYRANTYHLINRRDASTCRDIDSSLPENFKCSSSNVCISTDNSTSALCCPAGSDCSSIGTIDCDVNRQDPTKVPNSEVFTIKTDANLPTCGSQCCPFGYRCLKRSDGVRVCEIDRDRARFIGNFPGDSSGSLPASFSSSSSSSSATNTATSTTKSSSSSTSTSSSSKSTTSPNGCTKCDPFPPGTFFAGLVPGIIVGALGVLLWVGCTGRARKPTDRSKSTQRPGNRPTISEPIATSATLPRTDFLRRATQSTRSIFSSGENDSPAKPNTWKMPTPPAPNNIPIPPEPPVTPTPAHGKDRAPTLESIKIYSPPSFDQHPSAAVSPLRTKQTAGTTEQPRLRNPFESPIKADFNGRHQDNDGSHRAVELEARPASSVYEQPSSYMNSRNDMPQARRVSSQYDYPTLSQQRYDNDQGKRDTSFTALMEHCNIPDSGDPYPVPRIPEQYRRK